MFSPSGLRLLDTDYVKEQLHNTMPQSKTRRPLGNSSSTSGSRTPTPSSRSSMRLCAWASIKSLTMFPIRNTGAMRGTTLGTPR